MKICGVVIFAFVLISTARAVDPDAIGLSPLQREQPALTGAGIPVGQSEAPFPNNLFEINPSEAGQPASLFTWLSTSGTATSFPNNVGGESFHANLVGAVFYGTSTGLAPGVQHVRNYEANYYANTVIAANLAEPDQIVNNSWVAGNSTTMDLEFDNYAVTRNVLFVSGMDNTTNTPQSPGSCFNGIGVGRSDAASSVGPTTDGRCKPDLVVPGPELASYLTPAVAGSAALLLQAAKRNDGGAGTAILASNAPVIKALLLNGAVKPLGWTNGVARPLDARWGAGVLNVYASWLQLKGGRAPYIDSSTVPVNDPHPPTGNSTNIPALRGWDYNSLTSTTTSNAVAHYCVQVPANCIATATLVWERAVGATSAKNLDLFLYSAANSNLVASSQSTVDNVEHLFATNLPPGRYDLQVLKHGGASHRGTESYALAWDFVSPKLSVKHTNGTVVVAWPVNQAGLALQTTPNLNPPMVWQNTSASLFVTNAQNVVSLPATNPASFFRLLRP